MGVGVCAAVHQHGITMTALGTECSSCAIVDLVRA